MKFKTIPLILKNTSYTVILIGRFYLHRAYYWFFPHKRKRSPCKFFKSKKTIACYELKSNHRTFSFEHFEIYRITNPKKGEYYVFPEVALKKFDIRHISYHKSGAFHWREKNGEKISPQDGEADHRRAELMRQAMKHLVAEFDGYCIAVGRKVSVESLSMMLNILDGYILPPLAKVVDAKVLLERKTQMILMPKTKHQELAEKLLKMAYEKNSVSTISADELKEIIKKEANPNCRIYIRDPTKRYAMLPKETMDNLVHIARSLCEDKMKSKPESFWCDNKPENVINNNNH